MATIQKRGGAHRAQVRIRGKYLSRTFDTREEARSWAADQEALLLKGAVVKQREAAFVTPADLLQRYAQEVSPGKRGGRWEEVRIEMLRRHPGTFGKALRDFTPTDMADWRDARLKTVGAATVNRELNLVSAVFTCAIKEWGFGSILRENPVHLIKRPKNPPKRKRRVADAEILAIRRELGWDGASPPATRSQWVAWCHAFAIETTMRRGEIVELQRRRVHLSKSFLVLLEGEEVGKPGQTKNGLGGNVPLSRRAKELLVLAGADDETADPDELFVGVTAASLDALFRRAVTAAKIVDLHFHDSRSEAITRIAPKIGNVLDLAKITRHRDPRQLMSYYEPSAEELAAKLD